MRLFVYEYVTGGGCRSEGDAPPTGSLLREGAAMLAAVVEDLARARRFDLAILRDERLAPWPDAWGAEQHGVSGAEDERRLFDRLAAQADRTLVIAPEIDGALLARTSRVESVGGRLAGPSAAFVRIAADKRRTGERWEASGVPAPYARPLHENCEWPDDFPYPAVLKPVDGAGSLGVVRIETRATGRTPQAARRPSSGGAEAAWRLEQFCPGTPASVAVLGGPRGLLALPAFGQRLGGASGFEYQGGFGPLDDPLDRRARRLATAAVAALPECRGYVGVDLVLGEASDGSDDRAVEINPRLTTSYVGLRRLARGNLAQAMIDWAEGVEVDLCFDSGRLEFDSGGEILGFETAS